MMLKPSCKRFGAKPASARRGGVVAKAAAAAEPTLKTAESERVRRASQICGVPDCATFPGSRGAHACALSSPPRTHAHVHSVELCAPCWLEWRARSHERLRKRGLPHRAASKSGTCGQSYRHIAPHPACCTARSLLVQPFSMRHAPCVYASVPRAA